MDFFTIWLFASAVILIFLIFRNILIIPAQTVLVIERLGKYSRSLHAGFHILFPILDKVAYRHSLKEIAIDVPSQPAFTSDNVRVKVDGVLYLRVIEPRKASYAVDNYRLAAVQLAQTMMRSVIGLLELDKTFEERENINSRILKNINDACSEWGVQITRYEIQNIQVPPQILKVMEVQMKAERDKRALIAKSIGEMESKINYSMGSKEEEINKSEGRKQRLINEAQGRATEILAISKALAISIEKIAASISQPGGLDAVTLQNAEQLVELFGNSASSSHRIILPINLGEPETLIQLLQRVENVWKNPASS
jgi:regulator of protease activity HflC (stomatin/prohibitin superfamily)